jgi:hypothetical protein
MRDAGRCGRGAAAPFGGRFADAGGGSGSHFGGPARRPGPRLRGALGAFDEEERFRFKIGLP